jgi:23S rRNA-/tRNA-specific pseudouridylate synthase
MTLAPSASVTSCPVLYDAHGLLAVDKPEGVLSHPNPGTAKARSAFEGAYDFEERSFETPRGKIWLIHRLDQDTSGVLLAAREKSAARACRELFETGEVRKIYDALVAGKVLPGQGRWNDKIGVAKQKGRVRSRVLGGPPNAKLKYRVMRFFPRHALSLLEIELITGKTHQVRVQAAARRWPVAGDEIYGHFELNKKLRSQVGLRRLFLHAKGLELKLPGTGSVRIESPLPEKLRGVLDVLS